MARPLVQLLPQEQLLVVGAALPRPGGVVVPAGHAQLLVAALAAAQVADQAVLFVESPPARRCRHH